MPIAPDTNPSPTFDIDRQELLELKRAMLAINGQRLQRTRDSLEYRQQTFFDLLPLLLHVNHPLLPGYVSQQTPAGLSHYQPDTFRLRQARQLARGFRYQPLDSRERPLLALYVMGSIGTIGQSRSSDFDLWLCYRPGLSPEAVQALTLKCQRISQWARQWQLELCFFPMDAERFRQGETLPLSPESSGSTQHGLLLDEFYRSAILLAGRYPLWWLVPSRFEQHYRDFGQQVLRQRFVRPADVIDLGGLPHIPLAEFFTAAIWQLFKSIQSPYKSLLKLLLLENYASQAPATELLAWRYKQEVEAGCRDLNQLDPYRMMLEAIERYLRTQPQPQQKRQQLLRRCFYFKADKALTRPPRSQPPSWQRQLLQTLVSDWGWDQKQLQWLDQRRQWQAPEVIAERQQLVAELLHSYRTLAARVQQQPQELSQLQREITLLGRKLAAAFERRAGKIEWVNPDIAPDISEPHLLLQARNPASGARQWQIHACRAVDQPPAGSQLKASPSLMELIVWSYCNEIFTARSQAQLQTTGGEGQPGRPCQGYALDSLYQALRQWQPMPLTTAADACFRQRPHPLSLLIVLNLSDSRPPPPMPRGLALDPLNLGRDQQSLIHEAHLVSVNSWHEILVHTLADQSFIGLLNELLRLRPPGTGQPQPRLTLFCRESNSAGLIRQRCEDVLAQLRSCFHAGLQPVNSRFILQHGGSFHGWQGAEPAASGRIHYQHSPTLELLLRWLGQPQDSLSPIVFDRMSLSGQPLKALCQLPTSRAIQVGYCARGERADLYILDEKNSLFYDQVSFRDPDSLLRPLHRFLRTAIDRLCLGDQLDEFFGVYPVEFYRLSRPLGQVEYQAERLSITTEVRDLDFFDIQAIVSGGPDSGDADSQPQYAIYCDEQQFHSADSGPDLFRQVARHILSRRRQAQRYPCYLTDLDLTLNHRPAGSETQAQLQVSHYLRLKRELELELNQALQEL